MKSTHIYTIDAFKDVIASSGLIPPQYISDDGKIQRFAQPGDKGTPCWCIYHPDGIAAGAFGCFKRDISESWCSKEKLSASERKDYSIKIKRIREQHEAERLLFQAEVAKRCVERFTRAQLVNPGHPYLARKKVISYDLRQEGNLLLVPIYDMERNLVSLQTISPDGEKRFIKGAKKHGCCYILGEARDEAYIVEGYATGVTVHQLTQKTVIIAFDSGNLMSVAENITVKYPNCKITIAADNDHLRLPNVGLDAAKAVASNLGVDYVFPQFQEGNSGTDFNDLFSSYGELEVKKQLQKLHTPELSSIADRLKTIDLIDDSGKKSATTLLIEIGSLFELFHDGDGNCYILLRDVGTRKIMEMASKAFREFLSSSYFDIKNQGANPNAMIEALSTLEAKAKYHGNCYEVFRRIGYFNSKIYVDLCDDAWRVIEIDANGWRILDDSPIMFIRSRYSREFPVPVQGDANLLWQYTNVKESEQALILGWILGAYHPKGPYPVLNINGVQGSGKSFLTRLLRCLVDPNLAETTSMPRDDRDFVALAYNNRLVCLDNLSGISGWLSDAFCRMSTGSAISARRLYSNVEEVVYQICRPAILNGIPDLASRADLRQRCIVIELEEIEENGRMSEEEILSRFKLDYPKILGGIFTLLSDALRQKDNVILSSKPRMADFATWVVAAEQGAGIVESKFLPAYFGNIQDSAEQAADVSMIAFALRKLLEREFQWSGKAIELFRKLTHLGWISDEIGCSSESWMESPRKLRTELKRQLIVLKAVGISVAFRKSAKIRFIEIRRLENFEKDVSLVSL